jgi:para-aminobenzoate synthetase/4-amino-4-deoxychorismate lyase
LHARETLFRIVLGSDPALAFERPCEIVRGIGRDAVRTAFDRAEQALRNGFWLAGYVTYDWSAALGIFEPPRELVLPASKAEHSGLLSSVDRGRYSRCVGELQRAISDGNVYEVNYTVPFWFHTSAQPFDLYARYASGTNARYQAFVEDGDRAILSWSPELFLDFDGARVRAKPMKGTASLDHLHALHSEKNRAEHVMIVDLLRNDLHRVCDSVEIERFLEIELYPTFATMTSTVAGTVRPQTTLADLFEATFPCGSITGAPKRAAQHYISTCEPSPRGAYCGTIGFLSPKRRGWWNVAIRTAQIDTSNGAARYDAGGAIVADSDPDAEWEEVLLKTRFLRDGAGGFALLETFAGNADKAVIEAHLARLHASAEAFEIGYDRGAVTSAVLRHARGDPRSLVRCRLQFDGTFSIVCEPMRVSTEPVGICLTKHRVRSDDPFLAHKTSWRPAHDAAAKEALRTGCFDGLLRNERGEFTEGARTTLFAEMDGTLYTPPLESGLLPGIFRQTLLAAGRARERVLLPQDLRHAGAIFVANSARGMLRATLLE